MAVTHPEAIRNGIADYVVDQIDVSGPGTLEFQTSGDVEVATLTFGNPAFGNAAAGVATANAITEDSNATGGVIAKAKIFNGTPVEVVACAVGTGGSDINLSSLTIAATDTVGLSALTYTAPA